MRPQTTGTNAQGKLIVSALFLPFSDEIVDAAVADDAKQAPEAPEEVTQMATQLEVAMAVQDQLTSKVQKIAADIQQKVRACGACGLDWRRWCVACSSGVGAEGTLHGVFCPVCCVNGVLLDSLSMKSSDQNCAAYWP